MRLRRSIAAGFALGITGNLVAVALSTPVHAQGRADGPQDLVELRAFVDSLITARMSAEKIPGAAFVFVRDGRVVVTRGYGQADPAASRPVVPESTIFRIGSISKAMTALAVTQLADRGRIDLSADVNRYLRKVRVPTYNNTPVTAEQLLTHTAGFDEIRPGTQAASEELVQDLAAFLAPRLVRVRPPGITISYSTYGITLAGALVEEVSGRSFETYMREEIWEPLGMTRTNITVPSTLRPSVAPPYEIANGSPIRGRWEWYHTTPASSVNSTASDMAKLMIALLDPDRMEKTGVLSARATRYMQRQHATMHPRLPGFAHGFYEDYVGELRVVEHGGQVEGFSSLLVLIPEHNAGFFVVSHVENARLRDELKYALLPRYYAKARVKLPVPPLDPTFNRRATDYVGQFVWTTSCHTCTPRSTPIVFEVKAEPDGALHIGGNRWLPAGTDTFVRQDGSGYIYFRRDSDNRVTEMFLGSYWSFERLRE